MGPHSARASSTIVVVGGGHAGTEAARAAAAALGGEGRVVLVTMDPSKIGAMSCNPAIGGLAKGQMVREIDALGGLMGLATDAAGIAFRVLNASRGAAVRGPRAQCDKYAYAAEVQRLVAAIPTIEVWAGTVEELLVEPGAEAAPLRLRGVRLSAGSGPVAVDPAAIEWNLSAAGLARPAYPRSADAPGASDLLEAAAVVLTTGTFMRALMHTGAAKTPGGRVGEGSAISISAALRGLGFELGRLKTGTPPRLHRPSLDLAGLAAQPGDAVPRPFSDLSPRALPAGRFPHLPQTVCFETSTNGGIHELIRANLHLAPMYSGEVEAECGPRYCPSIEDKVVRFADRDAHHVYLEPESLHTEEIYCNGISTSLPAAVQAEMVRRLPGCERAEILKPGYAVEYDMVWPHQIDATGMTKRIDGVFLAGQINGTSGYEEAGGQGLIAGLNAARFAQGAPLVRLGRETSYLGVMMDDLVTRTPREPYRMFTSRAEHRLHLRADNADERLTPHAIEWGLADAVRRTAFEARRDRLGALRASLQRTLLEGRPLWSWCKRPETTAEWIARRLDAAGAAELADLDRVMTEARYEGYLARQAHAIRRIEASDRMTIPADLDPTTLVGLRAEAAEVLARFRPATLGQAGRLAGVNPADVALLAVAVARHRGRR